MKKQVCASLFAVGALLLASCGSEHAGKEKSEAGAAPSLRLESYSYDCLGEFESPDSASSDAARYVRFKGGGVLPVADGQEGVSALRDTLLKLADVSFNDQDEPVPGVIEGVRLTENAPAGTEAGSEVLGNVTVALVNPQVAVFEVDNYRYQNGAAHGNTSVSYVNYSVSDGKVLTLNDVTEASKRSALQAKIVSRLKSEQVPLLVKDSEVEVSPDFQLTNEGICFSYDPYEIAPYSAGVVNVEIPVQDLVEAGIITPTGYRLITGNTLPVSK